MKILELLKEIDKIREEYEKLTTKEAVLKMRKETAESTELINRVASFLSCIRDEKLEESRRKYQQILR